MIEAGSDRERELHVLPRFDSTARRHHIPVVGRAHVVAAVVLAVAAPVAAAPLPGAPDCPLFPPESPWNQAVDRLPVAAGSRAFVAAMSGFRLHPDFSDQGGYGIPFATVGGDQPRVPITFEYADESDPGPYPIPPDPPIEGGSDRHVLVVDRDACRLYEVFAAERAGRGWRAGSGAIFDLRTGALRPQGWTSADAAGLPILPGLARADEVVDRGQIDHALRFTVSRSQRAYLSPARHFASDVREPSAPPMGLRLRLKASFRVTGFGPQSRVILTALKRYGMIVADNGATGFISGAPSPRWDDDDLHALERVPASAFEVVDTTRLPGTPPARAVNARHGVAAGRHGVRFLHTAAGPVTLETVVKGRVVRRVRRVVRQGVATLSAPAVPGARYRLRAG
jgi:hypothetical protein